MSIIRNQNLTNDESVYLRNTYKVNQIMTANQSIAVSIVIPTFNRAYCLSRTIQSVLDQTFQDFEIIIVDNYSTDNTDEVVESFDDDRVTLLKLKNEGIVAASRNLGIKKAKGKYIAFLDSDDWWLSNKLQSCIHALSNGRDLVYHDLYLVKSEARFKKRSNVMKSRALSDPVFHDLLLNGNTICNSSVVVKKSLLIDIEGISEINELVGCEDFDCWLRIASLTNKFGKVDGIHGCYWFGDDNLSSHPRKLMNINAMGKRYLSYFKSEDQEALPVWMLYGLSRSHFGLMEFSQALKYSRLVLKKSGGLLIRLKALYIYLACKIHKL